jgi:lipoyl synthase
MGPDPTVPLNGRLPEWFKQRLPGALPMETMRVLLNGLSLHTVCQSALCPNIGRCFAQKTATFLILGDICTRHCTFCAIAKGTPAKVDSSEPEHVAAAAADLGLDYAVITSVTRDDLPDGGASQFAAVIEYLHRKNIAVEVLVPDFGGSERALAVVVAAAPEVLNHNVETMPRLYGTVRPEAGYARSLQLLSRAKILRPATVTKSGLMLGLGETPEEILAVLRDLRTSGCDLVTLGQYLQPSAGHHGVARYVPPEEFTVYGQAAQDMGFAGVAAAPWVRSSYEAAGLYRRMKSLIDRGGRS